MKKKTATYKTDQKTRPPKLKRIIPITKHKIEKINKDLSLKCLWNKIRFKQGSIYMSHIYKKQQKQPGIKGKCSPHTVTHLENKTTATTKKQVLE
jgi:hypothetical protein